MNIPDNLLYTETHEWLRIEDGIATVGITDHAQEELSDVVFVEMPEISRELKAGEACAVVESVKAASDIYAPAAGKVVAVNEDLVSNPALLNSDPYGTGWLFKIHLENAEEISGVKSAADYAEQVG
ncbi:MAG: glycine cleavage system protein GcvH [Chthoniobacteraceae bacterium]